jgi:hypothetical protein
MDFVRRLALALGHDPDAPREPLPEPEPAAVPSKTTVEQPLLVVKTAHHPGDIGNAAGADHYAVTRPLDVGRLHRRAGDALCKPAAKFWGLYDADERAANCKRCRTIAERLGLVPAREIAPALFDAVGAVLSYVRARGSASEEDVLRALHAREEEHEERRGEREWPVAEKPLAGLQLLASLVADGRLIRAMEGGETIYLVGAKGRAA